MRSNIEDPLQAPLVNSLHVSFLTVQHSSPYLYQVSFKSLYCVKIARHANVNGRRPGVWTHGRTDNQKTWCSPPTTVGWRRHIKITDYSYFSGAHPHSQFRLTPVIATVPHGVTNTGWVSREWSGVTWDVESVQEMDVHRGPDHATQHSTEWCDVAADDHVASTDVNAAAICLWWRARSSHFARRRGRARPGGPTGCMGTKDYEWGVSCGQWVIGIIAAAATVVVGLRRNVSQCKWWVVALPLRCASSSSRDVTVSVPLRRVPLAPLTSLMRCSLVSIADVVFPSGSAIRKTAWTVDMTYSRYNRRNTVCSKIQQPNFG